MSLLYTPVKCHKCGKMIRWKKGVIFSKIRYVDGKKVEYHPDCHKD